MTGSQGEDLRETVGAQGEGVQDGFGIESHLRAQGAALRGGHAGHIGNAPCVVQL